VLTYNWQYKNILLYKKGAHHGQGTCPLGPPASWTLWEAWKAFPEATTAFIDLTNSEMLLKESPEFKIVKRFVIILYHRTSMLDSVNDC
jgi:hypothetical protein